jgi:hypothetical protein
MYLDPGGYIFVYLPPIAKTLLSFAMLVLAYMIFLFYYRNLRIRLFDYKLIRYYAVIIIVWNFYYFTVYYGINNNDFPGIAMTFVKNPDMVFKSLIVFPVAFFSIFSLETFWRLLAVTTVMIGLLFIASVLSGLELVPTWDATRNVGGVNRNFMYGYGLMYFSIPIMISMFFLRFQVDKKMILAGIISIFVILLTVFRRDIIGILEFIIILSVLSNFVEGKILLSSIGKVVNVRNIILVSMTLILLSIFAFDFLIKSYELTHNTLEAIGLIESDSVRSVDSARMSLMEKVSIVRAIEDNFLLGTGYDPAWITGDGGDQKWEGSDYIFLAAFAMYGLIGLLLFLPFYFIYVKGALYFLKLVKKNFTLIEQFKTALSIPTLIGLAAVAELFKNILEYPNWYYPIGAISNSSKYFIYLALLFGATLNLEKKLKKLVG